MWIGRENYLQLLEIIHRIQVAEMLLDAVKVGLHSLESTTFCFLVWSNSQHLWCNFL
jgi:hypothetical protein